MDIRRSLAALLSLALIGATGSDGIPLREARWIAPEARVEMLLSYPRLCVANPDGLALSDLAIGFAAFRDPLLLGGQAARAGISCASCHRGGRGNTAFVFPGVSGPAGTADVTSSLLSSHRGDGIFNPKPIPDLTFDSPKVSRTDPGTLKAFIRGLIVDEFDGAEPPDRVLSGLTDAVRALDAKACDLEDATAIEADIEFYVFSVGATKTALRLKDRDTALAMLRAMRSALALIAERYPPDITDAISASDREIAQIQQSLRDGAATATVLAKIDAYIVRAGWTGTIHSIRDRSLYNPARLKAALTAPRTP